MNLVFPTYIKTLERYVRGDEIDDPITFSIATTCKEYINNLAQSFHYPETIIKSVYNHNYQGINIGLNSYPILRVYRKNEVVDLSYQIPIKNINIVFSYVVMFGRNFAVANLLPFVTDSILLLCQNTLLKIVNIPIFPCIIINIEQFKQYPQVDYITEIDDKFVRYYVNIEVVFKESITKGA
jgi:hypothetical protein